MTIKELEQVMKSLGSNPSEKDLKHMIKQADDDGEENHQNWGGG